MQAFVMKNFVKLLLKFVLSLKLSFIFWQDYIETRGK